MLSTVYCDWRLKIFNRLDAFKDTLCSIIARQLDVLVCYINYKLTPQISPLYKSVIYLLTHFQKHTTYVMLHQLDLVTLIFTLRQNPNKEIV